MSPLLIIFFTVLLDLIGFGIVIPLLTFYAEDFGASPLQVTLLMACYSLAQFLFAPMWGSLSDRYGRRPILLLSIGMGALMLTGFAAANQLWMLFVFRTLHGLFAANLSTAQAYIADVTTTEDRAKGMGLFGAAFGLGFMLGPWLGGELSVFGLSAPIYAAAALSALNFFLALGVLKESRKPGAASHSRRSIDPRQIFGLLRHPAAGWALALSFSITCAFSMMESTFALFEEHQNGLDPRAVGRLLGLIGVIGVIVQGGLIGRLVKRFGEGALVRIGVPGIALGILGLVWARPGASLYATCAVLACFQGITQPSLSALISKSASEEEQGLVLGTNQSLSALARSVGPPVAGALFSAAHPNPFFAAAGLLLMSTALAFAATARR